MFPGVGLPVWTTIRVTYKNNSIMAIWRVLTNARVPSIYKLIALYEVNKVYCVIIISQLILEIIHFHI